MVTDVLPCARSESPNRGADVWEGTAAVAPNHSIVTSSVAIPHLDTSTALENLSGECGQEGLGSFAELGDEGIEIVARESAVGQSRQVVLAALPVWG